MLAEDAVVEYVQGVREVPKDMVRLVLEYRRRQAVVDSCESYPRHVDDEMNALHDAMVVLVQEVS